MHRQEASNSKSGGLSVARLLFWLVASICFADIGGPSGSGPRIVAATKFLSHPDTPLPVETILVSFEDDSICATSPTGSPPGIDGETARHSLAQLSLPIPAVGNSMSVAQCSDGQSFAAFNPRGPPRLG